LLFPESVVIFAGRYRVHHSTGHRPDTETFLHRGLALPGCGEKGCTVSFELLSQTSQQTELKRFKAAS
jgi:hypothetical protein